MPCHAMASLQHDGKKWHCKNWNFWKNQCNVFFSPSNVPSKISISKINFGFSMIVFWLLTLIMMLKFQIFLIPNFNFWGVPSSFQGIVGLPWKLLGMLICHSSTSNKSAVCLQNTFWALNSYPLIAQKNYISQDVEHQ